MSTRIKFILVFAVAIAAAIAVWVLIPRQAETIALREAAPAAQSPSGIGAPKQPVEIVAPQTKVEIAPQQTEVQSATESVAQPKHGVAKKMRKGVKHKVSLQDPAARVALGLVGVDSDAEAYWTQAIFDSSLPDKEREDLMEDLNEVGFSNPQHPGPDDMPLIMNRIAIIERLAPYADPFMQRHLGEAYKDLNLMLEGKPVP